MMTVSIVGCGFVADLYMRSLAAYPDIQVAHVFDRDPERCKSFAAYWGVMACTCFEDVLQAGGLVLNLTNPAAHFDVTRACLEAGCHVYSEKPLAMSMQDAQALVDLAQAQGVMLASAPCSVLGEAAQTLAKAVREDVAGKVRLVYAELDDGFILQAPIGQWQSESGRIWPAEDEFSVGCTMEHAGYYLTWLIAMFGPVVRVMSGAAELVPDKPGKDHAPDFSVGVLYFENDVVARLTCSIVASHNHEIRVFGDKGVLKLTKAWDNAAPVRFHRRHVLRRRLIEAPIGRRIRISGQTHAKVKRFGAASMNFALGPVEMLSALHEGRDCRLSMAFALHLNEVTLALQNGGGVHDMQTRCDVMEPMPWAM